MTIDELKDAAANLSVEERFALADWLARPADARTIPISELKREIGRGLAQADRGELIESDEVFAKLRAKLQVSA